MLYIKLSPPENSYFQGIVKQVSNCEAKFRSKKLSLSKDKLTKLKKQVDDMYTQWNDSWGAKRQELIELNKLMEGKLDPTEHPFGVESSSQINVNLAAEKFRAIRASFRRIAFSSSTPLIPVFRPRTSADKKQKRMIEEAVNWTASEDTNLLEMLKDTDLPIFRDGIVYLYGYWHTEIQHGIDFIYYKDKDSFMRDYPSPEIAGISDEKYNEIIIALTSPEEADGEIETVQVEIELDFVKHDRPKYIIVPSINFIRWPFYPSEVEDLMMYGYPFKEAEYKFKERAMKGYYDYDIDSLPKRKGRPKADDLNLATPQYEDEWDEARDNIEGIEAEYKGSYKFVRLFIKVDLDGDGRVEMYTVIYWPEKRQILRVENYDVRRNIACIVPFKFLGKDNMMDGFSLLRDGKDLFNEINAFHRHRSNIRRLTSAATLLIPEGMKDLMGDEYIFAPGNPIWVPDNLWKIQAIPKQLQIMDLNQTNWQDESLSVKYLEGLMGPSLGLSGQNDPTDPRAPGNKTALLLHWAAFRVQDLIDEWRRGIPKIMALHVSLYYQNGISKIEYKSDTSQDAEIDIALMVQEVDKYVIKATSISVSPEIEMQKIASVAQSALMFGGGIIMQLRKDIFLNLWNDYIVASKISGWEKYLIDTETALPPPMALQQAMGAGGIEQPAGKNENNQNLPAQLPAGIPQELVEAIKGLGGGK